MRGDQGTQQSVSVELRGVRKEYDSVRAVDGVSLEISAGEFVTLLGASGSGKTTTLMIIAGFVEPDEGSVWIAGRDMTEVPPYRRRLGMVYQHYALFPHMTVAGNVGFPLEMRGWAKREIRGKVKEALALVHLEAFEDRLPAQLSGGQQQRVALARALVFEPPVLLMDEPLGALDKKLRDAMQKEIKQLQMALGITTIYVTHDQEEALTMSDRIVVMDQGRIAQVGSAQEVYERPANRFVADFMGATNFLRGEVLESGQRAVVRTEGGAHLPVANSREWEPGDRVLLVIRPERVRIRSATGEGASAQGRIRDVVYTGGARRYEIDLGGDEALTAVELNLGAPTLEPNGCVDVTWKPEDAWLVPDEGDVARKGQKER